jgi:hypothetical protein
MPLAVTTKTPGLRALVPNSAALPAACVEWDCARGWKDTRGKSVGPWHLGVRADVAGGWGAVIGTSGPSGGFVASTARRGPVGQLVLNFPRASCKRHVLTRALMLLGAGVP